MEAKIELVGTRVGGFTLLLTFPREWLSQFGDGVDFVLGNEVLNPFWGVPGRGNNRVRIFYYQDLEGARKGLGKLKGELETAWNAIKSDKEIVESLVIPLD